MISRILTSIIRIFCLPIFCLSDNVRVTKDDVIEIRGKRRTVAKCLPLYPSDVGKGIIRVDGLVRNNAGVAIGETVVVRKIKAVPAEKVIVAPLEAIPPIDERYLADALESVPLIKGNGSSNYLAILFSEENF